MGEEHSDILRAIKKVVANIDQIDYYAPWNSTRVKCDASHSGLIETLQQKVGDGDWIPIAFAARYLNS